MCVSFGALPSWVLHPGGIIKQMTGIKDPGDPLMYLVEKNDKKYKQNEERIAKDNARWQAMMAAKSQAYNTPFKPTQY